MLVMVEVGKVGDEHLGDLLAAHADRLRCLCGRREGGDQGHGERGGGARVHVPTRPPLPTPRLPLRSLLTFCWALVSVRPEASSAAMRTRAPRRRRVTVNGDRRGVSWTGLPSRLARKRWMAAIEPSTAACTLVRLPLRVAARIRSRGGWVVS